MKIPLRMLHVEDNPAHVEMVRMLLEVEGFGPQVTRVETEGEFRQALAEGAYDLIVSDCTIPSFNGLAALALAQQRRPDLPFIFYSGTIGEEAAVESLKRGAMDFVPKGRPEKLSPTIRRVLQEAEDRRLRQDQRLREQRVESIGTLAAGIAHGLNNVLAAVLAGADQLYERVVDDNDRQTLAVMRTSARRGAQLVNDILAFTRGVGDELTVVDLHHLMSEVNGLINVLFPRSIRVETRLANDLHPVRGKATQLYQVLMNLCVNARDAMPDGGVLSLEAANVVLAGQRTRMQPESASGPYVMLVVKDAGVGIPPELLDKVFEPFFTTKPLGKGAGLGLSTSLAIVQGHGGFVDIASEVRQGTVIKVYLPALGLSPGSRANAAS
jgi:signal transduction histidine kinase